MVMKMAPQNADSESMQVQELPGVQLQKPEKERESKEETISEGSIDRIPVRLWVMHGAVMFGREFCYAMETALVTPVLLQIGLPEQYYSLTWFLSPILGLIFTPLIGSASDRCTLSWGRRRPFILALCIGVLIGVALFLNGSVIDQLYQTGLQDLALGPPWEIVKNQAAVLVPAKTELSGHFVPLIFSLSVGLGGAIGYMLGGLNWMQTILGSLFKSQEQVLFFFAAIIFSVSVVLHLCSIEEEQYNPQQDRIDDEAETLSSVKMSGSLPPFNRLNVINEEEPYGNSLFPDEVQSEQDLNLEFLEVDIVRSKSDSVLHMPDATLDMESELLFLHEIEPSIFQDSSSPATPRSTSQELMKSKFNRLSAFLRENEKEDEVLLENHLNEAKVPNGNGSLPKDLLNGHIRMGMKQSCTSRWKAESVSSLYIHHSPGNSKRGFGIDCAILSCQVYISQILVASALGSVVDAVGTVRVIPVVASVGSFLGFLTATFLVIYPDVGESLKEEQKELAPPAAAKNSGESEEKLTVIKLSRGKDPAAPEVESESAV
ncbi:solute carrier family 45 member 4 [Pseudonaja textilis]|uniref:solute carrier family 45 member 4 n=1 Tax=Pseudonaja textilis TaxID=8673 RepID=UPI000EA92636|nr:solute carrier family 45 member 4 [Pseudonaja textilis]